MIYDSGNLYRRFLVESSLIKFLPNYNSLQSILIIDNCSPDLILTSKPRIIRKIFQVCDRLLFLFNGLVNKV